MVVIAHVVHRHLRQDLQDSKLSTDNAHLRLDSAKINIASTTELALQQDRA